MQIEIDGIKTEYIRQGKGKDVLLLHGWGGSYQSMQPITEALRTDFRVTALDFPGHGSSQSVPGIWTMRDYMEFTMHFMQATGIERCHVVAHSFGGRVAILAASQHPERFEKLVLTGCAGLQLPPTFKSKLRKFAYDVFMKFSNEKLRDLLRDMFSSSDYKALSKDMKKTFVNVINQDLRPCLPKIKAPTLLIWGSEDTATPISMGRIMEKEIPDAGLVIYEGCDHFAYLQRSADFNQVTRHFLMN